MEFMDLVINPIFLTCFSIILSLLSFQILSKRVNKNRPKKKYPPIAGTVFHQLLNFKRLHHYMTHLASKHKTYRILNLRNEIYTSDPLNVEYILKTNFDNYGKGSYNYEILKDLLGDGIFTVDGEKWRQQRKISSYEFSTRVLRDFSSVIFRKNASKVAMILSEIAKTGQTIDFQDLSMKATLDSIFQVAFGAELDTMCGSSEEGKIFSNAFDDASSIIVWRYVDVFWKIKKFLNIGLEADMKRKIKIVNDFVFKLIQNKIEQMKNDTGEKSTIKREDILSRFLHANEHNPVYLRDVILNIIIAGKDTTATSLAWLIYLLCKHPHVQRKIVDEVREVTKIDVVTNYAEFADCISEEVLEKLHYLHAAITETLRIYPSVPVDPKTCFSDDTLPDGSYVKKGDIVFYQPYAMGRMKFLWGEDAEEFKPERWLDKDGVFQPQSSFKFTAFQAGPRLCLGKDFAYRQLKIFAAVLLSSFVFKMGDENRIAQYRTMINLHIDGGLEVRVFDRNGQ